MFKKVINKETTGCAASPLVADTVCCRFLYTACVYGMVTGSTDHRMYNRKHNETQKYVKKQIVYADIGNLKVKGNIIVVQHFFIHIL